MPKYAYTIEIYRHIDQFVGPFDSWRDMMKSIEWLVMDDDGNTGDHLQEILEYEPEEDPVQSIRLRIFTIEEQEFDQKEIINAWRTRLEKENRKWAKINAKQQEDHDRREYERLKKKFKDQ